MTTTKKYDILKNKQGERFVKLYTAGMFGKILPADMAGLCAGRDAWISRIECECNQCGRLTPLRYMQGNGQWCEACSMIEHSECSMSSVEQ